MGFGFSKIFGRHAPQALIPRFAVGQGMTKAVYYVQYDPYQNRALRGNWNVKVGGSSYDVLPRDWPNFATGSVFANATGGKEPPLGDKYGNQYDGIKMDRDGRIYPVCSKAGVTALSFLCPGWTELNGANSWIIDFGVPMPTPTAVRFGTITAISGTNGQKFQATWTQTGGNPEIIFSWSALLALDHDKTGIPFPTIYPEVGTTQAALPANQQPFIAPLEVSRLSPAVSIMRHLDTSHINGQQHRNDTFTAFARYMPGDRCTNYKGSKGILSTTEKVQMMNELGCGLWFQSGLRDDDTLVTEDVTYIANNLTNPFVVLEKSNETWNSAFQQFQDLMIEGVRLGYGDISSTTDSTTNGPINDADNAPSRAIPLDYNVIFDLSQDSIDNVKSRTLSCAVPDRNYVVLGMSQGTSVFQAIGAKNAGDLAPLNWANNIAFSAGECAYVRINQTNYALKIAKIDVPATDINRIPYTNATYWDDATAANAPWVLKFNADQTSNAGQRYHMEVSRKLWQSGADAFKAVGKRRPINILNLQTGGTPPTDQFYDRVNFGTGYKLLDAVAFGAYLGNTGNDPLYNSSGTPTASGGGSKMNAVGFNAQCSWPWDLNGKRAMYDAVTNGKSGRDGADEAVKVALENYYSAILNVGIKGVTDAIINFRNNVVQAWYDNFHPELNKKIGITFYEYQLQGIFESGWPDENGNYSDATAYEVNPQNDRSNKRPGGYTCAVDPVTHEVTTYRCIQDKPAGLAKFPPDNPDYWVKIDNCTSGQRRIEKFFNDLWVHPKLGDVHQKMFDTLANQTDSFVIMGFCTANAVPTTIGAGLSTFTIRPQGNRTDIASWQRFVTDRDRMIAKGGFKP